MSDLQVAVTLTPLGEHFSLQRTFTLSDSNKSILIGRSSKREQKNRCPGQDNGWYESRVMSRDHAELWIETGSKVLNIDDLGSTHGTWLNNIRLAYGEPAQLFSGDILRFGVNVENGQESFPALVVRCKIDWSGEEDTSDIDHANGLQPAARANLLPNLRPASSTNVSVHTTNTFCVPEDDSDIEEIPFNKFGWAAQKPEYSHVAEEDAPHFPTPTSSETHDLKDDQPTSSSTHADPKANVTGSDGFIESAAKCVYPQIVETEPAIDVNENEEFDKALSLPYEGSFEDQYEHMNEEMDRFNEEIEDSLLASDLDDDSNDEYASEDISSASDASDVESTSSDGESGQHFINPVNLTPSNIMPIHSDTLAGNITGQLPSKAYMPDQRAVPTGSIHHVSSPQDSCKITSLLNCLDTQPLDEREAVRACDSIEDFLPLKESKYSSTPYHDGPFVCGESTIKETNYEPITPMPKPSMKRKASEIELEDVQVPNPTIAASQEPNLSTTEQSQVATAISSALAEAERPSKRVKSSNSSPNLAGYTATAIVSALLGGLGTIALLAALPAEYFQ